MTSIEKFLPACLRALRTAAAALPLAWAGLAAPPAWADCPGGDPCETATVYRVQGWPNVLRDAAHRDILSLQEANATDDKAFLAAVASMATGTSLAIRYTVTRIAAAPNDYCTCNLETAAGKGCPSSLPAVQLLQCTRNCRFNNGTCKANGVAPNTATGGKWYSFPASSAHTGAPTEVWAKNAFSVKPNNRDWREDARVIKRASCIATEMARTPKPTLDALFANEAPCATVSQLTLQAEQKH